MLIDHTQSFDLKSIAVKTAATFAMLVVSIPMMAQATDITTTRYTVRFDKSLTQSKTGVEKVYAMIEKKAKKACRENPGIDADGKWMTRDECLSDMITQFVESADLAPVTTYHKVKMAEAKALK